MIDKDIHNNIMNKEQNDISNSIDINDIFKFIDLYYNRTGIMYTHQYNAFNKLFDEDIKNFLEKSDSTFFEKFTKDKIIKYKFEYSNIAIRPPMLPNEDEIMFPSDARNRNITYNAKLIATVTQIQEIIDITTDVVERKIIGKPENEFPIAYIPVMLRSKYCALNIKKGYDKSECEYDPGGYFIIYGSEKVVIPQERMVENKPLVFLKKDSGSETYVVQVNSKSHRNNRLMQVIAIKMKNNIMTIKVPIINELPVVILLRALGIETDRDIIDYIVYNEKDLDMINIIRTSLNSSINEKGIKIQTQQEALEYLLTKMRVIKKYSDTDKIIKQQQRLLHLRTLLENNFLPHIEGGLLYKAYYIGYMINRLLKCYLKRLPIDDRDSYINKRIDLIGNLMEELISQHYRKMLNECNKYFKKRNQNDENPLNVINQIKPTIIEQGLRISLMTGAWGRKKGVAQMLQRLSFKQMISFERRIDSPGGDASTSKLTSPRHLHPSSLGFACCLTGDTKILQATGEYKQIKDMTNNDEVITYNLNSGNEEKSKINNWFVKQSNDEYLLKLYINETIIKCTKDHPILVYIKETLEQKYIEAQYLKIGMDIIGKKSFIDKTYNLYKIILIEQIPNELVYDFTTESSNHNFVANGIVVHNCVETPEHANVGLTKHLSLIGNITIISNSQFPIIKNYMIDKIIDIRDIKSIDLKKYTKVFLNGEWLGLTDNPMILEDELKYKKLHGIFDNTISIVNDIKNREIKVYCDSGRLFRPVIRVDNNSVLLTKELINNTSINKSDKKISDWNEFMIKYPYVIEYIDMEEQPFLMIAPNVSDVEIARTNMIESIDKVKDIKQGMILNRYDNMKFVRYTHCEFHPSLLIGNISTNIPFCNHNAGPRNIFSYAQSKQGMGIYASNYRDRLDISYILYHPQKPLITTRTAKYIHTDVLTDGENCIVAIACYGGFNQEDSLYFNKSAIERGLFKSTSLKKFKVEINKNQSTSQDDVFMKPIPDEVTGLRNGSYDKLNDKGYIPEETIIYNNDIIMAKLTPINPVEGSNKKYKDSSIPYISHAPGVIDKVYTNIYNNEGFEMRKVRVRSERIPGTGDKFACYTPEHEVLTINGWISIENITLDHKIACLINETTLEYHKPRKIMNYDFKGNIYNINTEQIKLRVTPNHRMYVSFDGISFKIIQASDLYKKKYYVKNLDDMFIINNDFYEHYEGKVYCCEVINDGIIYVRKNTPLWCGNSRHGQKGTCGILMKHSDLPYTKEGITPDIIVNPNAIPSRMTLGQIIECVLGKVVANKGTDADGTPFGGLDIETIKNELEKLGYNRNGTEEMYNGMTGQKMKMQIFIGPTYYQRLKHLVLDKIHCLTYNHEVLTTFGWKKYNELTMEHEIATLEENKLVYRKPLNIFNYPEYEGKIYRIKTNDIDLEVTDKHRMWVSIYENYQWSPFCFKYPNEIFGKNVKYLNNNTELIKTNNNTIYESFDHYKGGVFCVHVPSEIFYVRYNNKEVWTGNSRARGPRTLLTRQAPEGRSRDGGLRLGEMERDAIVAHGMALYLKEKMLDTADPYGTFVCDECGLFAERMKRKGSKPQASNKDIYFCPGCKNKTRISKIMIPYAFKLLLQEMMSMCIAPRIRVEQF
jgi:DNA-directed RNA polymerase beta subunit